MVTVAMLQVRVRSTVYGRCAAGTTVPCPNQCVAVIAIVKMIHYQRYGTRCRRKHNIVNIDLASTTVETGVSTDIEANVFDTRPVHVIGKRRQWDSHSTPVGGDAANQIIADFYFGIVPARVTVFE